MLQSRDSVMTSSDMRNWGDSKKRKKHKSILIPSTENDSLIQTELTELDNSSPDQNWFYKRVKLFKRGLFFRVKRVTKLDCMNIFNFSLGSDPKGIWIGAK